MSLTKEQAKIKKKWLKALRSGDYKQGEGALYKPKEKSFCCLGVLEHCLLDGKVEDDPGVKGEFAIYPSSQFYKTFDLDWVRRNEKKLANLNDGYLDTKGYPTFVAGVDFNEIADHIEKKWV